MSAAVTVSGHPFVVPGFNYEAHDLHVAAGYCAVVQSTKAWCVLRAGHPVWSHEPWHAHASLARDRRHFESWDYP